MSDAFGGEDKEDLRIAMAMLRMFRGWSQADLAQATGLGASAVSRYESGAQEPTQRTLDRILMAVGLRPLLIRNLLIWIHKARAELLSGASPDPMDDAIEAGALELAEALSTMLRSAKADLDAASGYVVAHPQTVEELWNGIKEVPAEDWPVLAEAIDACKSWQFCALLCDKSLEAAGNGNRDEALEIARFAVLSAEMSEEPGTWRLRIKGYALAHLAAALHASGDPDQAKETMQRARTLWDTGDPAVPSLLNEGRLRALEASVRAERKEV